MKDLEINTYTWRTPENKKVMMETAISSGGLVFADITLNKSIPRTSEIE